MIFYIYTLDIIIKISFVYNEKIERMKEYIYRVVYVETMINLALLF